MEYDLQQGRGFLPRRNSGKSPALPGRESKKSKFRITYSEDGKVSISPKT